MGTTFWIQGENILARIYILKRISTMQCSRSTDSSETNYYTYADTLTQCSISFPHPPTLRYVLQTILCFFYADKLQGRWSGGGDVKHREWLWGSDRDGTGHDERTNLFYSAFLTIKQISNTQLQINNVLRQQTGNLRSKVS